MICAECQDPAPRVHVTTAKDGQRSVRHYCMRCASAADIPGIDHLAAQIAYFEHELVPILTHMADRGASWRATAAVAFRRGVEFESGTVTPRKREPS